MFTVEFMGDEWSYALPKPYAAALLAGMGDKDNDERVRCLYGYIEHCLAPESVDLLWERAFDEGDVFDSGQFAELIELVQSQHSARPFHTDVSLATTAVRQWPQVRGRLVMAGVSDPLRQLPNIFALIDAVEAMILDGMGDEKDRHKYFATAYKPPVGSLSKKRNPKGWDAADELAMFDDWEGDSG